MTSAFDLHGYLARETPRVEEALARALTRLAERLPRDVADAARHGVLTGGKRLRPILCITAFRACGGETRDEAYDLAASLELIHAYSLMHDDLPCMDDAELRRGLATTHRKFGERLAVQAGFALIPGAALQAFDAARSLGCGVPTAREAGSIVMRAAGAGGMVGGQWLDLEGENRALGATELHALHRKKTGALLAASLLLGATAARAAPPIRTALLDYGWAVGLAFQITDDVLDATQTAERLGKHPSDQTLGKSTYVSLYGLEGARAEARRQIDRAHAALQGSGLEATALHALAEYVGDRTH